MLIDVCLTILVRFFVLVLWKLRFVYCEALDFVRVPFR